MVKIHKSSQVFVNSGKPMILDLPQAGNDLRNRMVINDNESAAAGISPEILGWHQVKREDEIIEQAKLQAEQILANAGKSAIAIREQAYQNGYKAGLIQADLEREIWLGQTKEQIASVGQQLSMESHQLFSELEEELLDLSLQIAERVIHLELSRNDQAFLAIVADTVGRMKQADQVTLKVSLDNYWKLLANNDFLRLRPSGSIKLVADESISEGGCRIESPIGIVESSLPSRLEKIRKTLKENRA